MEAKYHMTREENIFVAKKNIAAVNNLKHAWQFVLDTLDCPTDYPFVCRINQCVGAII